MSAEYETYTPMEEPEKRDNRLLIIIAVVLVILCCCCLLVFGSAYWFWINGDQLIEDYLSLIHPFLLT